MNRQRKWTTIPLAIALSVVVFSSRTASAINITFSGATPATDVILEQLTVEDSGPLDYRTTAGHRFWGQTFTAANDYTLDKVSFLVATDNETPRATEGMTMKVDVFSASSVSSTSGTTLFGSPQTGVTPNFTKGVGQWITFDVDNVALTQGEIYGFSIDFAFEAATIASPPGPNPNNGHLIGTDFGVFRNNGDNISGGQMFEFSGGVFNSQSNRELVFVLQGSAPPPVLPVLDPDVDFTTDPGWVGVGNTATGNNYGLSLGTNNTGALSGAGEAGGTFARNNVKSYYADTNLEDLNGASAGDLDMNSSMSAIGRFDIQSENNADGNYFLGHMSSNPSDGSFMGIEFFENGRWRAAMGLPGGGANPHGADNSLPQFDGDYYFEYEYDANTDLLTVHIFNEDFTYDETSSVNLSGHVAGGSVFDAFGMGINLGANSPPNSNFTAQFFLDDVSYTGFQVIPEPSAALLASMACLGLMAQRRRHGSRK